MKFFLLFIIFVCIIFIIFYINYFKYRFELSKKLEFSIEINKIYSDLYYAAKSGKASKPKLFTRYKYKNYLINKTKGICLCTIAKQENLYAREFVEYYYLLKFDKIIIFDNNEINGEKIEDILGDYLKNNFIDIIDIRGLSSVQIGIYNFNIAHTQDRYGKNLCPPSSLFKKYL